MEDLPYLTPSSRMHWLEERASEAATPAAQWKLLEILRTQISRRAAAAFVRSDAGAAFLRKLEDADRDYARLVLEELPGCRQRVRSLWKPEAGPD